MIPRHIFNYIKSLEKQYQVITITGPRQAGKTTLCRALDPDLPYVNLEDPDVRQFAMEDPRQFLSQYPDGAILDEIQRVPNLPSYLQGMIDDVRKTYKFYLSGSQSFALYDSLTQSLAGRTAVLELLPFSLTELLSVGTKLTVDGAIFQGCFPRIYDLGIDPNRGMADYLATYVERDLRQLNMVKDLQLFQKFIQLCAGRIGQVLNLNSLANDVGISPPTAREWLTLLEASYIVFRLPPYFKNIGKRLIKSPKLYFCDTALVCYLLNIEEEIHLKNHPLKGQLFENLVVLEMIKSRFNRGKRNNLVFFRDSNGNEVDILQPRANGVLAIEVKLAQTFHSSFLKGIKSFSKSEDLSESPWVVYQGTSQDRTDVKIMNLFDFVHRLYE